MKNRGFEIISKETWIKHSHIDYYENVKLPERKTKNSAGYDFNSPYLIELYPGESTKIGTGIKSYMLSDEYLSIYPRSGLGFKYFVRLANTVGIVDSDYYNNADNEGHIFIKIRNEGSEMLRIEAGESFAQGIFSKYLTVDDDNVERERVGGLGSTSK